MTREQMIDEAVRVVMPEALWGWHGHPPSEAQLALSASIYDRPRRIRAEFRRIVVREQQKAASEAAKQPRIVASWLNQDRFF